MKKPQVPAENIQFKFKNSLKYLMVLIVLMLVFSFFQSIQRSRNAHERINNLRKQVEELETQKQDLQYKVGAANTEGFVESELRTKLGLVKENEIVIILPEADIVRSFASRSSIPEESLPDPNWRKWMNLFL